MSFMDDQNKQTREKNLDRQFTAEDYQWLKGELKTTETGKIDRFHVPRKIVRNLCWKTIITIVMLYPVIPYSVNKIIQPTQKQALLEQLSPQPENRQAQKKLTNSASFNLILIAEFLTLVIWIIIASPDFQQIYQLNRKYDLEDTEL